LLQLPSNRTVSYIKNLTNSTFSAIFVYIFVEIKSNTAYRFILAIEFTDFTRCIVIFSHSYAFPPRGHKIHHFVFFCLSTIIFI
jgi:hypothetical protein